MFTGCHGKEVIHGRTAAASGSRARDGQHGAGKSIKQMNVKMRREVGEKVVQKRKINMERREPV